MRISDWSSDVCSSDLFELKASGMKMGGGAKPFGVDVPLVPALLKRIGDAGCDFRGFHIFSGSQNLDASALIEAQAKTVALAAKLAEEGDRKSTRLNSSH